MMGGSAATTCKLEYNINITTMKQILSLWDACPQGGKHRRSVFLRLLLLVCMLATASAGWADTEITFSPTASSITTSNVTVSSGNSVPSNLTIENSTQSGWKIDSKPVRIVSTSANITKIVFVGCTSSSSTSGSEVCGDIKTSSDNSTYNTITSGVTITDADQNAQTTGVGFSMVKSGVSTATTVTVEFTNAQQYIQIAKAASNGKQMNIKSIKVYIADAGGDTTPPTLSSSNPADGATGVATSGNITLTFSENVNIKDASKFSLSDATLGTPTVSGSTVTIPYSGLSNGTQYTLSTAAGAVQDAANNENAALSDIKFTTVAAGASSATFVFTTPTDYGTASNNNKTFTKDGFVVTSTNTPSSSGGGYLNVNNTSTALTISAPENTSITNIVITYTSADANRSGRTDTNEPTPTTGTYTRSGAVGTWEGVAESVSFRTFNSARIQTIEISTSSASKYTVTTATGLSNGSIAASPTSAAAGATITVTGTPATGYKLDAVTVTKHDDSSTTVSTSGTGNSRTFTMPAYDVDVTATFVVLPTNNVTIAYSTTPANGTLTASASPAQEGSTVTITAEPAAGYRFASLSVVDGNSNSITVSGSGNTRTFKMPATAVTVTGNFVQLPRISTSATNGTVTTSPASYAAEGTIVTITATANQGYSLADLTVLAGSTPVAVTDNQFTMPSSDVTITATFVEQQISADERWNFTKMSDEDNAAYQADATNWSKSSSYYSNLFTANASTPSTYSGGDIVQIQGLKYIRTGSGLSANNIQVFKPTSTADGYMKFVGGSGRGVVIPGSELTEDMQVTIDYEGGSDGKGFTLTNAKAATGTSSDVTSITSATRTTATFYVKTTGTDIQLVANNSNIKLYKITLGSTETVEVAEPTFNPVDGTEQSTGTVAVRVTTNQTVGTTTTYYGFGTTAMTRDELVSGSKTTDGEDPVSPTAASESDIVISAVTKAVVNGKTYYSDVVTATYPYTGKRSFSVSAPNLTIQQGDRQVIQPVITFADGTVFDPADDTLNNFENLTDYFDFTFQKTTSVSSYVTVDGSTTAAGTTGEVNTKVDNNEAPTGTVETIHVTAKKKEGFSGTSWPFKNEGPVTADITVSVIAKAETMHMSFYWDPEFTRKVTSADYTQNGSVSVFNGVIPNGRMIYVKAEEGYTVYCAGGSTSQTVSKVSKNTKSNEVCYYQYRNGCALQFEDTEFGGESEKDFYLNLATYNSAGKPEGVNVQSVFTLSSDNGYRPAAPTYDPTTTESNPTVMSTAQTVAAVGSKASNYVFSKFSSEKTTYSTPNLPNEDGIQVGIGNVGVFSTEVAHRRITGVQIEQNADTYWYISKQNGKTVYDYTFATELTLTKNDQHTTVYKGTGDKEVIPLSDLIKSITYYNKDEKKDIDITSTVSNMAVAGVDDNKTKTQKQTVQIVSVTPRNGADLNDYDATAGTITIGQHSGSFIVTFKYPGGTYKKTVNGREGVTASSTATYTIYITDPSEQIPNITPPSRNFNDGDEVSVRIQAPTTWDVLYMEEPSNGTDSDGKPTFANPAFDSSDTSTRNCTLLKAGEFVMLTITNTSKVRAFAFNPNNTAETSKEVSETYTKLDPLKAPVLSPYGEPHMRTTTTLKVTMAAQDAISGLIGFYTTDGTDPTPTTGEQYNGSEGINISGSSTTVKAIVYDPNSGRISPVTTGVYVFTANIDKPVFHVSGTGAGNYTEGTVTVDYDSQITITGPDGSQIFYTLDGSTPTAGASREYDAAFVIVKNTTGKAAAVKNDASSPVTTVEFVLNSDQKNLWEAVDETTPSGKMAAGDRYVVYGKSEGNSSKKAVKYLTATFGGMDATGWSHADISESTKGTPLDGVGSYSIRNIKDAWDESGKEPQNTSSQLHERTFKLPAQGDMVRFEPERDGRLTIWLLQQGGLNYTDDGEFCDAFIRLRPVYMLDEQGNSIEVSTTNGIKSSARLSSNWDNLKPGAWTPLNKTQNGVTNIYYDETQSTNIYNMYSNYLTTNEIGAGDAIAPFALTDATVKGYTGINGTGYVMPSGGYVRYTFNVKGGKTYFLFGYRTKLGVRGFRFKPSDGQDVETLSNNVTMADDKNDATSKFNNNICNVTYNRQFEANTWAAIVLPFSVSRTQLQKVFGDGVDVLHLEKTTEHSMDLKRHWYPMIVAGTPVLIKPSQKVTAAKFYGVHYEANSVTDVVPSEGAYKMTGSFGQGNLVKGDYYVATDGSIKYLTSESASSKSCRSWFTPKPGQSARASLMMGATDAFAEEVWNVAGNPQPFVASDETVVTYINGVQEDGIISNIFDGPTGIYTINGQLIRKDATSLEGLSKGIYIVNGKKIAIK